MAEFVKFDMPKELVEKSLSILERARKNGKVRIGANETTKAIERQKAKLVLMAEDVTPAELLMPLPLLCNEKNIPYGYVKTKKDLGQKAGIEVGTSAVAVVEEGEAKKDLEDLVKKLRELRK